MANEIKAHLLKDIEHTPRNYSIWYVLVNHF